MFELTIKHNRKWSHLIKTFDTWAHDLQVQTVLMKVHTSSLYFYATSGVKSLCVETHLDRKAHSDICWIVQGGAFEFCMLLETWREALHASQAHDTIILCSIDGVRLVLRSANRLFPLAVVPREEFFHVRLMDAARVRLCFAEFHKLVLSQLIMSGPWSNIVNVNVKGLSEPKEIDVTWTMKNAAQSETEWIIRFATSTPGVSIVQCSSVAEIQTNYLVKHVKGLLALIPSEGGDISMHFQQGGVIFEWSNESIQHKACALKINDMTILDFVE